MPIKGALPPEKRYSKGETSSWPYQFMGTYHTRRSLKKPSLDEREFTE